MGFLDHTTNNIIVDAVLTDKGRQKLASAAGLNIKTYAFADTEVDYTLLKKYGEVVGKEKIEKNTPIFEANTGDSIGSRHSLLTDSSSGSVEQIALEFKSETSTTTTYTVRFSGYSQDAQINYSILFSSSAWTPQGSSSLYNVSETIKQASGYQPAQATLLGSDGTYSAFVDIVMNHTTTPGSYLGSVQVVQANSFSSSIETKAIEVQ